MSGTTFLNSVAEYYFNTRLSSQSDWSRYTFVLTSHRAGSYFKHSLMKLVQASGRTIFGLNICTIDELFSQRSKYVLADNLTLTFKLFEVYKEVLVGRNVVSPDDKILTFEFFYSWAQTFIGDFDDIDKYLADPKQLFENVFNYESLTDDLSHLDEGQIEAIRSFWNVVFKRDEEGKEYHEVFLSLYDCLYEIYGKYREMLHNDGLAYNGMMYRDVAERFSADADSPDAMHYAFIGFNALTSSERIVFKRLVDAGLADFFWDYSNEIVQPMTDEKGRAPRMVQVSGGVPLQQPEGYGAGRFVSIYKDEYPAPKDYTLPINESKPEVNVTSVAYSQSQVSCVCQWLNDIVATNESLSESALVLGDESMLIPVLQSMPSSIDKVNITMGYPLKYASVYSLVELLSNIVVKGNSIRSNLVIPVIQHPTMTLIHKDECKELYSKIVDNRYIYLKMADVTAPLSAYLEVPNDPQAMPTYILGTVTSICQLLENRAKENDSVNLIELEAAKRLRSLSVRFSQLMTEQMLAEVNDARLVFRMFVSFVASESIDFIGDKYDGLQIMGMMETRSLDYKNICVISLNEGEFPKSSTPNTFIPRSLRYWFGLPTQEFRDSIFAYYFFRLIARAEKLNLVYHSNAEEGEQSRFLLQLQYQYALWNGKENVGKRPLTLLPSRQIEVPKTQEVLEKLYNRFNGKLIKETGRHQELSATAISQYKACSLAFYFSRVVRLHESDELEEEASAPVIGKIFHKVMETLYNPDRYPHIYTEQDRQLLLKDKDNYVKNLVEEVFRYYTKDDGAVLHGRNILYHKAIENYVFRLLEKDAVDIQFSMPEESYCIPHNVNGRTIYLGGDIDRTHRDSQSRLWIIDYKTGSVKSREFKSFEDLDKYFAAKKVMFQTFLYAHFVYSAKPELRDTPIVPGVIAVRSLSSNDNLQVAFTNNKQDLVLKSSQDENYIAFKEYLSGIIGEIFDENVPFKSTNDTRTCSYCKFASLCSYYMTKGEVVG